MLPEIFTKTVEKLWKSEGGRAQKDRKFLELWQNAHKFVIYQGKIWGNL
jgi:hypothetical protein